MSKTNCKNWKKKRTRRTGEEKTGRGNFSNYRRIGWLKRTGTKKVRIPPSLSVMYVMIFASYLEDAAQNIILKTVS